jgi:hydrogenase maturation protease
MGRCDDREGDMNELDWQLLEDKAPLHSVRLPDHSELQKGGRARLRPRPGGDVMDLALAGKIAVIESIEQDYEGSVHVGVVLDDDPGCDIGHLRQPGHRFFFRSEELEPLTEAESPAASPRILVAGIGNVFFGDDGFGVEVAVCLSARGLRHGVQVVDFGIRSYDLAYALTSGRFDAAILVDATTRGGRPGDIYVLSPELGESSEPAPANAHAMNPETVLRMARTFGPLPSQILVVACEPETLGGEEGQLGLSEAVSAAVDRAVPVVESLMTRISNGEQINAINPEHGKLKLG